MASNSRKSSVGTSPFRKEDTPLLTGRACFVDDLKLAGAAHACYLRSPHAHARIESIDVSAALASPGVLDVIVADDLPRSVRIPTRLITSEGEFSHEGIEAYLQPPLAEGTVRYSGEPVAMVIAESRYLAEDAADRIEVAYETLRAVERAEDSLAEGAPVLFHGTEGNLAAGFEIDSGGVEEAFAAADVVVEETLHCGRHGAVPLEARGLAAELDHRTGVLTLWGAAKIVHLNHAILAELLEMAPERLRLVELHVGGGFGARGEIYPEDFTVPFAARRLGRPVAWTGDREEDLRTTNHSREQTHEIALALSSDGDLLAMRDRITFNTGAYVRTHGTVVPSMSAGLLPGPYRWGEFRCEVRHVVTNKTPAGTYRSPGRYEANFARERMLDIAARRLGLDPFALRRRNLIDASEMPFATGSHIGGEPVVYDSGDYPKLMRKALKLFDPEAMREWRAADPGPGRRRGIGAGLFVEKSAIGYWDYARVGLESDGRAVAHVGAASIGQGLETVMAQICADAIGIDYEEIAAVRHGDTAEIPAGMGSFGSRATVITGGAVHEAGRALRRRILERASEMLEAAPDDLRIADGRVSVRGSRSRGVSLAEVARASHPSQTLEAGIAPGMNEESYHRIDSMSYPYGFHLAAVEVDTETGAVEIARYLVAYDVGKAVNPVLVHGQIVGGAAQGIAGALLEEFVYSPEGQLVAGSFMDYLLPTAGEVPEVEVLLTEDAPSPLSPIGAKGAGEGGTAAAGAALSNAVSDAVGAEAVRIPLTPERILELVREGETAR